MRHSSTGKNGTRWGATTKKAEVVLLRVEEKVQKPGREHSSKPGGDLNLPWLERAGKPAEKAWVHASL